MGLFTWIRGLLPPNDFDLDREIARRRGSNPPAPGSKPAAPAGPPCGGGEITRAQWEAMRTTFTEGGVQRGNGNGGPVTPKPPIKPQPTGGRLIYVDRDPGPAEVPCDELMQQWRKECQQLSIDSDYTIPASSFMAQRVVNWAHQQQAQSLQLPPPGADPVATDEELMKELADLWPGCMPSTVRRTIYQKGRADERTAILRALGVEP